MKLDKTFARELRAATGYGLREEKFALLKRVDAARADLSRTDVRSTFNDALRKHGRVPVGICVAATLDARRQRIDYWGYEWAREVLRNLPGWTARNFERGHIDDGIHPTAICDYARSLIECTTGEA